MENVTLQYTVFGLEQKAIAGRQEEREREIERMAAELKAKGRSVPTESSRRPGGNDYNNEIRKGWILKKGQVNTSYQERLFVIEGDSLNWYVYSAPSVPCTSLISLLLR